MHSDAMCVQQPGARTQTAALMALFLPGNEHQLVERVAKAGAAQTESVAQIEAFKPALELIELMRIVITGNYQKRLLFNNCLTGTF